MNLFSSFLCAKGFSSTEPDGARKDDPGAGIKNSQNVEQYSRKQLKAATAKFSSLNEIGHGGFGSVFKGKLRDGSVVAIKVLSSMSRQGEREFVAEIVAMSNITHANLLKLRGFCADGNFRALVYDYMDNGSVARTLLAAGKDLPGRLKIDWRARRDILLGVANGLAYLHDELNPSIVHRDIKASNILLDGDLTPKISDFGLARLFPDNVTHVSTRVAGTLGYLAPEYAIRGQLTPKSDIYSYGVLMLEIISGRSATDFTVTTRDEPYIVEKAWDLYNAGKLQIMADEALEGEFPVEEVVLFVKVGLLCLQATHALRPTMRDVVKMMNKEKEIGDIRVAEPAQITDFFSLKVGTQRITPNFTESISDSTMSTTNILG